MKDREILRALKERRQELARELDKTDKAIEAFGGEPQARTRNVGPRRAVRRDKPVKQIVHETLRAYGGALTGRELRDLIRQDYPGFPQGSVSSSLHKLKSKGTIHAAKSPEGPIYAATLAGIRQRK